LLTNGTRLVDSEVALCRPRPLFLVDDDVIAHEAQEAVGVVGWRHSRNSCSFLQNRVLEEVLNLLVNVVVLKIVNDTHMVDIATTATQELVAAAFEALAHNLHLTRVRVDGLLVRKI